eukprot:4477881-Amphidinium_carterae.1
MDGTVGRWKQYHGTIVPGCSMATRLVKLLFAPMLAALGAWFPQVVCVQVVDDYCLQAVADIDALVEILAPCVEFVVDELNTFQLPLSEDKCKVLAMHAE